MSSATAKPWLASYAPGTAETINPTEYQSILEVMERAFDRFRHRPAFSNMGKVLSYGEIDRLSLQLGGGGGGGGGLERV